MRLVAILLFIVGSYVLLLLAPGLLPPAIGLPGLLVLTLAWVGAVRFVTLRVRSDKVSLVLRGLACLCLFAMPFNLIYVGCYVFNQCP